MIYHPQFAMIIIPLQLLEELTSPFLYIGRITDSDHSEGNVPVLNNLLKYSVKKYKTQGPEYLKSSLLSPSEPAALLSFNALIAACTSEIVMTSPSVSTDSTGPKVLAKGIILNFVITYRERFTV